MPKLSKTNLDKISNLTDYYCTARLLTEVITLEDEKRKIKYLSPFADAPNVAEQVAGVMLISYALALYAKQKNSNVDAASVCELIVWHDAPEARYGDLGRDQRKYIAINEEKARADIFGSVSWGTEVIELIEKFETSGNDINSKLARDADALYVIYTIKDLLNKGAYINQPDIRIQKTLKRMTTEEGHSLGEQMASRKPNEIWRLLRKISDIDATKNSEPPKESLATIMAIAWALIGLNNNSVNKNKLRYAALQQLLGIKNVKAELATLSKDLVSDSSNIYLLLVTKRNVMKRNNKQSPNFRNITSKLKTMQGRLLGKAITEIDPYEWWQLLMGYAVLSADGKIDMKTA